MTRSVSLVASFTVVACVPASSELAPPPALSIVPAIPIERAISTDRAEDVAPPPREPEPPPRPKVVAYQSPSRSSKLASGFFNPIPGGVLAGYLGDTGLDIAAIPRPVYALASGTLDYSEAGHTLWTGPRDTANCIRFELDEPIQVGDHRVTHVYYAHLSKLAIALHEGDAPRVHVEGGDYLGESGVARGSPHLHVGLLLDGEVEQVWGTFLREDAIRKVLGGLRNGYRLPKE